MKGETSEEVADQVHTDQCHRALLSPIAGYASLITLDEGPVATSRANVPANTVPGDVILCDTAVNAARTDCSTPLDRSDIIFMVHPGFVWVTRAGYRLSPPQWK